jgi:hypothetical protein
VDNVWPKELKERALNPPELANPTGKQPLAPGTLPRFKNSEIHN